MFELFYLVFLIESLEELIDLSNLSVRGGLPVNLTRLKALALSEWKLHLSTFQVCELLLIMADVIFQFK